MESTTQYEIGIKQQIKNIASIDVTAFYKNILGLANTIFQTTSHEGSLAKAYFTPNNVDFGTIKGLAFSFNLRKLGPLSAKIDYTLSHAEGTGSAQASSFVAAFRNTNGEVPQAIANLDFDQRHTLVANLDLRGYPNQVPKWAENMGLNLLVQYNSGRPYTPVEFVNILSGNTNYGVNTQYINTAYAAGVFRIDLKVDKQFTIADRYQMVVFMKVFNLLGTENFTTVWRSTGEPDNTAYLDNPEGQQTALGTGDPEAFISDYKALEKDPTNYGLARQIRLGVRFDF